MPNKYKVVVSGGRVDAGPLSLEQKEMLRVNGEVELIDARSCGEKEFLAVAKDADAILGAGKFFNRKVIEALSKCRVIVTYGVGFDQVDVQAATDNGIVVANNPASAWCDEEVANHAIALLLACSRKIALIDSLVRKSDWAGARQKSCCLWSKGFRLRPIPG
jgi:D-3-phosphoglycerate dehydrogenase